MLKPVGIRALTLAERFSWAEDARRRFVDSISRFSSGADPRGIIAIPPNIRKCHLRSPSRFQF